MNSEAMHTSKDKTDLIQLCSARHLEQGVVVIEHCSPLLPLRACQDLLFIVVEFRILFIICMSTGRAEQCWQSA